ncbi:hypothetical protein [Granulicella mallensis]|uniref:DUF5666 domain-containing protein n=1 Tax=Granulicella mallensis (strain ATCC BAA-1857 / DSM 23137 / MP5ACTX8) TaxID=682795 RepID=G8NZV7_GRAMM|nr:hypothetical protein [Granulicella mallensis]AEU34584.1 hypothetical protein AciX8_0226 [Granulicella mallensis MP5ACTX8]
MLVRWSYFRKVTLGTFSAVALAASLTPAATAQDALVAALQQKYRLSEINMQGVVAKPGTVLTVEADGINAEPYPTMITFENPVIDGQVKQRSKGFGLLKSTNLQILQPGQKVYITKIHSDTQGKEDSLKVTILTTDAVLATYTNGAYGGAYQTPKRYSTTLAFKEPKGTLAQMSPDDASKMIEAILSVNPADQVRARASGVVARSCEPHCAVSSTTGTVVGQAIVPQDGSESQASAPPAPLAPPPPPADAPAGPPPTISLGQTRAQVQASFGTPTRVVKLGTKEIEFFKDMKVTFVNDKVTDVQ